MSLGALSREAHEVLAIAMKRPGAEPNGGEDPVVIKSLMTYRTASPKQVASGRSCGDSLGAGFD